MNFSYLATMSPSQQQRRPRPQRPQQINRIHIFLPLADLLRGEAVFERCTKDQIRLDESQFRKLLHFTIVPSPSRSRRRSRSRKKIVKCEKFFRPSDIFVFRCFVSSFHCKLIQNGTLSLKNLSSKTQVRKYKFEC